MKNFVYANEQSFRDKVIDGGCPCVVYFWAAWSLDCKRFDHLLDKMEEKFGDKVKFVGINVNECPNLTEKYNVNTLPTTLFFKKGELKAKEIGVLSEAVFLSQIKRLINV